MKVVYIAGPYTDSDPWIQENNIRRAENFAYVVALHGAVPLCPHTNTRPHFAGLHDRSFWLEATIELMLRCDAVLFIPDWEKSKGACNEHTRAIEKRLPIFYNTFDLAKWIKG